MPCHVPVACHYFSRDLGPAVVCSLTYESAIFDGNGDTGSDNSRLDVCLVLVSFFLRVSKTKVSCRRLTGISSAPSALVRVSFKRREQLVIGYILMAI